MKTDVKKALLWLAPDAAAFYLLPLFMRDTGGAIYLLLSILPMVSLAISIICGVKCGFVWWFGIAAGLLFLPSIFLYYNETALVYALIYGVLSEVGVLLGGFVARRMNSRGPR